MKRKDIFQVKGDGRQDDSTFYSLGNEFYESARHLVNTPCVNANHTAVAYYLFCHSAELFIKAFLHKKGSSIEELKKEGHNLVNLIYKFQELSNCSNFEQLSKVAKPYCEKYFEYRKNQAAEFAQLDLLELEIRELKNHVFSAVSDF